MLFRVHKNTVRGWLKSGLKPIDGRRPILILGRQLASFIHARREYTRQRCKTSFCQPYLQLCRDCVVCSTIPVRGTLMRLLVDGVSMV